MATQSFEEIQEQFKNISRTKYWFLKKEIFFQTTSTNTDIPLKHKTFAYNLKVFIELKKFKNIQEPSVKNQRFQGTIQGPVKSKNIQEHSRISGTSGHPVDTFTQICILFDQYFYTFCNKFSK